MYIKSKNASQYKEKNLEEEKSPWETPYIPPHMPSILSKKLHNLPKDL